MAAREGVKRSRKAITCVPEHWLEARSVVINRKIKIGSAAKCYQLHKSP